MPKVVESKLIIRGEDQATPDIEKIYKGVDKVHEKIAELQKAQFLDASKFERVSKVINFTVKDFEKLVRHAKSFTPPRTPPTTRSNLPALYTGVMDQPRFGETRRLGPQQIPVSMAIPVRVVNWPGGGIGGGISAEDLGGPAALAGGGGGRGRVPPRGGKGLFEKWFENHPKFGRLFRMFTGGFARTGHMASDLAHGAVGGVGGIGNIMSSTGGGMMAAAGGFGAIVGLPLLLAGTILGLGNLVTGPARDYYTSIGKMGLGAKVGPGRATAMRHLGKSFGMSASETAQLQLQMWQMGAESGTGQLLERGWGPFRPNELMPLQQAMISAGGAYGGKSESDFKMMWKDIAGLFADKSKLPRFGVMLEKLTGFTQLQTQHLADLNQTDKQTMNKLIQWSEAAPTAALRNPQRFMEFMSTVQGYTSTIGPPSKEVMLYNMLARNPAFREAIAGEKGMNIPAGGNLSWVDWMRMRHSPTASMHLLQGLAGMGDFGKAVAISSMNINPNVASEALDFINKEGFSKFQAETQPGGKFDLLKSGLNQKDVGQSILDLATKIDEAKIEMGEKLAPSIMKLDASLLLTAKQLVDNPLMEKTVGAMQSGIDSLNKLLGGEMKLGDLIQQSIISAWQIIEGLKRGGGVGAVEEAINIPVWQWGMIPFSSSMQAKALSGIISKYSQKDRVSNTLAKSHK